METRRPQLSVDELQQLKWLLGGALALFSAWSVFYLDVEAWVLLALNSLVIVAGVVWPRLPGRMPPWVYTAAFPAIVAIFVADLWLGRQTLPAMIRLALMLILYRNLGYRGRRDDLQLVILGLFLVVLTGVVTVSLAFAAQILAFTACALGFLFLVTLVDAAEAQYPPVRVPLFTWNLRVETPAWTRDADWLRLARRLREVLDWRVLALGAVLFAGVVAVSALLFLAIPRFQLENNLFIERLLAKKSRAGFTDNIRFGDVTDIIADDRIALNIDVSDPRTLPAIPYLRMVVLDEYSSGGFKLSTALRNEAFQSVNRSFNVLGTERPRIGAPVWTFYLEAGVSRYLPLPGSYDLVRFRELQNATASRRLRVISLRAEPATMTAYQVQGVVTAATMSDPGFADILADPNGRLRPELVVPDGEGDRAVLERVVREITGGAALSAAEFSRRACAWLAARHPYSLRSSVPAGNGDLLVRWLAGDGPGHCEFFAGAYALLARTAGHPTRLVSGFMGGSWNGFSNSLTVRNANAHAWCETWNGEGGWLRVDPTPHGTAAVGPSEASIAADERADRSWTARMESVRIFWYRRIVNFDQGDQATAVRSVSERLNAIKAGMDSLAQRIRAALTFGWNPARIAKAMTLLVAVVGFCWAAQLAFRSWRWRGARTSPRAADPVRREAGRWLRRLSSARSVQDPDLARDLERLRYGAQPTWPAPAAVFRRARHRWRHPARAEKR